MSHAQSVFFLSYDEENAEENWHHLLKRAPQSRRVHGISGILEAHRACAERSETPYFFVVDADNEILDFDFSFEPEDNNAVHVWRCKNAVNDLVYGYGAVKLFSRENLLGANMRLDLATALAPRYRIVSRLASITRFNTSPYRAWRAGFRECVKLSSFGIKNQNSAETTERLKIWCEDGADRPFGEYCLAGARAGRAYGENYRQDPAALARINDFSWLALQFKEACGSNL